MSGSEGSSLRDEEQSVIEKGQVYKIYLLTIEIISGKHHGNKDDGTGLTSLGTFAFYRTLKGQV